MKYKNYVNPYTKDNKIYSKNDISNMSVKDAFSREKEILAQHSRIGIPSDEELQNSENVVWVEEYQRSDGTEVKGHWRSKPGRGSINPSEGGTVGDGEEWTETSFDDEWVDLGMEIIDIAFGEKFGPVLMLLAPVLRFLLGKFFSDDEEDNTEQPEIQTQEDLSLQDTPTPQEPSRPQSEQETPQTDDEKNQDQISQIQQPDDSLTGAASEVKEGIYLNYDEINKMPSPTDETQGIAGVKKGEPMTIEQAGGKNVNPNYGKGDDRYGKNCQACIGVFEARLRGYDIEALPFNDETHRFLEYHPEYLFINPETKLVEHFTNTNVYNNTDLEQWLNTNIQQNERYMLQFMPHQNANNAHLVSVYKDQNGDLVFNDVMTGTVYGREFIQNFKYTTKKNARKYKYSPKVLRTDNKLLNISKLNTVARPSSNIHIH